MVLENEASAIERRIVKLCVRKELHIVIPNYWFIYYNEDINVKGVAVWEHRRLKKVFYKKMKLHE